MNDQSQSIDEQNLDVPAGAAEHSESAAPVLPQEAPRAAEALSYSAVEAQSSSAEASDAVNREAEDLEVEAASRAALHQQPSHESVPENRPQPTGERHWYILKVQSNREDSIRDALDRRVKVAGLQDFFGDIIVPIEMVSEFKGGKKKVVKRKLYPGYIVVNMEINEDTWFLVRETPGIGDFTGSGGKPSPMLASEVSRIVSKAEEKTDEAPKLKISFRPSDRVKITEGTFENFEGDVDAIDETNGRVTVMINIFGRSTPVELEYWQIEAV